MSLAGAPPIAVVTALSHVALEVADLERSIAFYREVLGLVIFQDDRTNPRQPNVKGLVAGFGVELAQALLQPVESGGHHWPEPLAAPCLSFAVTNIEAAFETLKARGCVEQPAPTAVRGVRFFFFRDPDGQRLELIEFPAPIRVLGDLAGRGG